MSNRGIDIREAGASINLEEAIYDSSDAAVTTGTATATLFEMQSDSTLKVYDFNDNTFKTSAPTTPTLALTHRAPGSVNSGVWTGQITTLTGFTVGRVYMQVVSHTGGTPKVQIRKWQYGDVEGDGLVSGTGSRGVNPASGKVPATLAAADASGNLPAIVNAYAAGQDPVAILGALNTAAATGDPGTTTTLVAYLKQLINVLIGSAGVATFPASAVPGDAVSLAEIIRKIYDLRAADTAQSGDAFGVVNNGTYGNAAIKTSVGAVQGTASATQAIVSNGTYGNQALLAAINANLTAINNINNLSALANIYGPPILEIPDSSSTLYPFTLIVRDSEGHLADLDSSPTLAAINAAGTDRSANLSSVTHAATGRYTFTYSVASNATEEGLRISATGAVSSSARYVEIIVAVANYDSITTLAAIKAKTDNLPADPASEANATSNKNSIITKLSDGTITLNAAYDAAKTAASATAVAAITAVLSGITSLKQWLGMLAGKQAGDSTALTEIRATGAGSGTFNPTTDSGEALRDRGDLAWTTGTGGGGGGGGTTLVAGALGAQTINRTFTVNGGSVFKLSIAQSEGKTLLFKCQVTNSGVTTPYDLTGKDVLFNTYAKATGAVVLSKTTADAITLSASADADPGVNDQASVDIDPADTADVVAEGVQRWQLRVTSDDNAYVAGGDWVVEQAPLA
jgi:hypothetical protein